MKPLAFRSRPCDKNVNFAPTPIILDYEVEQWLLHGGPNDAQKQEIRSRFKQSVVSDQTGLDAREEKGVLKLTHQTAVFVLEHAATAKH
jgi:hypothetical protein